MRIAFISGNRSSWGGSEVLWSQAALRLRAMRHDVMASVHGLPATPRQIAELRDADIIVRERRMNFGRRSERLRHLLVSKAQKSPLVEPLPSQDRRDLEKFRPDLVCLSQGGTACALEWMEYCLTARIPYIVVSQANAEWLWPQDAQAERLSRAHAGALVTCFVSQRNLILFETQIAAKLPNSRVVWNPFQISYEAAPLWPEAVVGWKLACVGRLSMTKGQDLILQVLADPLWKDRPITISFFGSGPIEHSLRRLSCLLGVEDKVVFQGHVDSVESIWAGHHALLMPSRCEGLPLALVEAMLCGRPAIVTDVAGNTEVVEDERTGFVAAAPTRTLVAEAMERGWRRRADWRAMGQAAAASIRRQVPSDPVGDFVELLLSSNPQRP